MKACILLRHDGGWHGHQGRFDLALDQGGDDFGMGLKGNTAPALGLGITGLDTAADHPGKRPPRHNARPGKPHTDRPVIGLAHQHPSTPLRCCKQADGGKIKLPGGNGIDHPIKGHRNRDAFHRHHVT